MRPKSSPPLALISALALYSAVDAAPAFGADAAAIGDGHANVLVEASRIVEGDGLPAPEPAGEPSDQTTETILVEGRREVVDLSRLQSAAPISVIDRDRFATSGSTSVIDALQHLLPSVNIPLGAANTFSSARAAKSVSLHGLGPDETLVLIDGKRQHLSSLPNTGLIFGRGAEAVDLNTIPLSAIDHIEVLTAGAASQYGSDAIGGVVNVILRKDSSGGDIAATAGNYLATDKPKGRPKTTNVYHGSIGRKFLEDGYVRLSLDVDNIYHPRDGRVDTRQYYFTGDPRELTVDKSKWCTCNFPADENSVKTNFVIGKPIGSHAEFYGFVNYGHTKKTGLGFATLPSSDSNVRAITPDGYQALAVSIVDDISAAAGIRVQNPVLGDFDFSINGGSYDQFLRQERGENAALGLATPIGLDVGDYINREWIADAKWSRRIDLGLRNPLNLSGGLSFRHNNYQQRAGEPASYATGGLILDGPNAGKPAPSGGGLTAQDAVSLTRNVESLWVNAETRLTSAWLVGVAGRVEHYSDFGTVHTEKAWTRFDLSPSFSLSGSAERGFRAPALGQISYAATSYQAINGILLQSRALPVSDPIARALGAQPLRPERSNSYQLRALWQPLRRASIEATLYQTGIKNRITITNTLSNAFITRLLATSGFPAVNSVSFFINALNTRTRGLDLVGRYGFDFLKGDLDLTLSLSAVNTKITHINPNPAQLAASGLATLVDRRIQNLYTGATPKTKAIFSARYAVGKWELNAQERRYGSFEDDSTTSPAFDQKYPAQWISDISAKYSFKNGLYVIGGVNNVFNSHPGLQNKDLSVSGLGLSVYSDLAPEGGDGTYFYATIGFKF